MKWVVAFVLLIACYYSVPTNATPLSTDNPYVRRGFVLADSCMRAHNITPTDNKPQAYTIPDEDYDDFVGITTHDKKAMVVLASQATNTRIWAHEWIHALGISGHPPLFDNCGLLEGDRYIPPDTIKEEYRET